MEYEEYECPLCGAEMKVRQGPKIKFYGCSRFPECKGKRTLDGKEFGIEGEEPEVPPGLDEESERWFISGLNDGMSYGEAREMAFDWQRHEND